MWIFRPPPHLLCKTKKSLNQKQNENFIPELNCALLLLISVTMSGEISSLNSVPNTPRGNKWPREKKKKKKKKKFSVSFSE